MTNKRKTIETAQAHAKDTGSAEVQISLLTGRIESLTDHFKKHLKDHAGRRGLIGMVNRRRKLLDYIRKSNFEHYRKVIARLGIRK